MRKREHLDEGGVDGHGRGRAGVVAGVRGAHQELRLRLRLLLAAAGGRRAAAAGVLAPAAPPAAGAVAAAGGLREFERSKTVKTTV